MVFRRDNTTNAGGLPDNYVSSLLSDRGDTLWAGTWIGGVPTFVRDTLHHGAGGFSIGRVLSRAFAAIAARSAQVPSTLSAAAR